MRPERRGGVLNPDYGVLLLNLDRRDARDSRCLPGESVKEPPSGVPSAVGGQGGYHCGHLSRSSIQQAHFEAFMDPRLA